MKKILIIVSVLLVILLLTTAGLVIFPKIYVTYILNRLTQFHCVIKHAEFDPVNFEFELEDLTFFDKKNKQLISNIKLVNGQIDLSQLFTFKIAVKSLSISKSSVMLNSQILTELSKKFNDKKQSEPKKIFSILLYEIDIQDVNVSYVSKESKKNQPIITELNIHIPDSRNIFKGHGKIYPKIQGKILQNPFFIKGTTQQIDGGIKSFFQLKINQFPLHNLSKIIKDFINVQQGNIDIDCQFTIKTGKKTKPNIVLKGTTIFNHVKFTASEIMKSSYYIPYLNMQILEINYLTKHIILQSISAKKPEIYVHQNMNNSLYHSLGKYFKSFKSQKKKNLFFSLKEINIYEAKVFWQENELSGKSIIKIPLLNFTWKNENQKNKIYASLQFSGQSKIDFNSTIFQSSIDTNFQCKNFDISNLDYFISKYSNLQINGLFNLKGNILQKKNDFDFNLDLNGNNFQFSLLRNHNLFSCSEFNIGLSTLPADEVNRNRIQLNKLRLFDPYLNIIKNKEGKTGWDKIKIQLSDININQNKKEKQYQILLDTIMVKSGTINYNHFQWDIDKPKNQPKQIKISGLSFILQKSDMKNVTDPFQVNISINKQNNFQARINGVHKARQISGKLFAANKWQFSCQNIFLKEMEFNITSNNFYGSGQLELEDTALSHITGFDPFLKMEKSQLKIKHFQIFPFQYQINSIQMDSINTRLIKKGNDLKLGNSITINEKRSAQKELTDNEIKQKNARKSSWIRKINLENLNLEFLDSNTTPAFQFSLTDGFLNFKDISELEETTADFEIAANINQYGRLACHGEINFMTRDFFIDSEIRLADLDVSIFSPYVTTSFGYEIFSGKMKSNSQLKIKNRKLETENLLQFYDLKLIKSNKAYNQNKLNLLKILEMLKDKRGLVTLEIPFKADLSSSEFQYTKTFLSIVKQIMTNTAGKMNMELAGSLDKNIQSETDFNTSLNNVKPFDDSYVVLNFFPGKPEFIKNELSKLDSYLTKLNRKNIGVLIEIYVDKKIDLVTPSEFTEMEIQKTANALSTERRKKLNSYFKDTLSIETNRIYHKINDENLMQNPYIEGISNNIAIVRLIQIIN